MVSSLSTSPERNVSRGGWVLAFCGLVVLLVSVPCSGAETAAATPKEGTLRLERVDPLRLLRQSFEELARFASDLQRPNRDSTFDVGAGELLRSSAFHEFEKRLPRLRSDVERALRSLLHTAQREEERLEREATAVHASLERWRHVRLPDRGGESSDARREGRARAFGQLLLADLSANRERQLEARMQKIVARQRQLEPVLIDLTAAHQRSRVFFARLALALPQAQSILETDTLSRHKDALTSDFARLGKSPQQLVETMNRVQKAMVDALQLHVETLETQVGLDKQEQGSDDEAGAEKSERPAAPTRLATQSEN